MSHTLVRPLLAELIGTALLVAFGAGSVVAGLQMGAGTLGFAGLGFVALTFSLVIAVAVYALGPVSGAHINPVVTLALAVTGRFPWRHVLPYLLAQLVGGAVGGLLILGLFGHRSVDLGMGLTVLGPGVDVWQAVLAEGLGTFLLMLTIMAMAVDPRAPAGWAGLMIGLSVGCAILLIGPLTGGSLNPARTFGPDLALALGGGQAEWGQFVWYWIGPLVGAVLAALCYDSLAQVRLLHRADAEPDTSAGPPARPAPERKELS